MLTSLGRFLRKLRIDRGEILKDMAANRGKEPKVLSKDDELYKRFHRVFRGVRI